jgi:hypothetical protein
MRLPPAGKEEVLYKFYKPTVAYRRFSYVNLVEILI